MAVILGSDAAIPIDIWKMGVFSVNSWTVVTVFVLGITILLYVIISVVFNAVYAYDDYLRKTESIKHNDYAVEFIEEEDIPMTDSNCPNCGAPVNPNQCACAYCNTPYTYGVDLSRVGDMALKRPDPTDIDYPHILYADDKPIVVIK